MTGMLRRAVGESAGFTPGVSGNDALARYWLGQATLRLRREIGWLQRASLVGVDAVSAALDLARHADDRAAFFESDITAAHLSARIAAPPPAVASLARGSFGWLARRLGLDALECFVLALALLPAIDSAAGPVLAACQNDDAATAPTLALAQRLWDDPDALLQRFDAQHPLFGRGVLVAGAAAGEWHAALTVAAPVARTLLFAAPAAPAHDLAERKQADDDPDLAVAAGITAALAPGDPGMRVVPVIGPAGADLAAVVAAAAARAGVHVARPGAEVLRERLPAMLTAAWLRGDAVYLPVAALGDPGPHDAARPPPLPGLPLTLFVGATDRSALRGLGDTLPAITVPPLGHDARVAAFRAALPGGDVDHAELARRFRYERPAIARIGRDAAAAGSAPGDATILAAARAGLNLGSLAQPVTPRFARAELMLPPAQSAQLDDIVTAMRNLTRAHYDWGTARAWNEGGLAVLFAGPPGTGKTMAAEAIAGELALPMYRIDLSQVVNKYIGETEKNLRTLFDAADAADIVLFFDEADALFGKRTEVKDAHDRYANLEISYLLERMERFRGLAILATNRRKDLDEAFLRRLRFVVEMTLPGVAERLRIWRGAVPEGVDASGIDFDFLAERFALAGGHIRGIVFNACLQGAAPGAPRRLGMPGIVSAVAREYDKLGRASSLDQFGPYAALVAGQRGPR